MRRIPVDLEDRSYEVVVGRGLMTTLDTFVPDLRDAEKAFVITHPSLHPHVQEAVASLSRVLEVEVAFIPEGETSKSLDQIAALYEEFAARGAHRHDIVVTFGGGVVSDAAGFVASTYARGMPLIHVPTTLLGQVDAAIGGKTAINLARGKNLVGTIYQPIAVVCDVDLLASCPAEEMRSGMAEVIKYGFIAQPDLLELIGSRGMRLLDPASSELVDIVSHSAAIKASIVSSDEREHGVREHLNYGHTFAHAFEKVASFGTLRHGEAVALGMMAAAYLAEELDRIDDQVVALHASVLGAVGLPTSATFDLDQLDEAWRLDKKYRKGLRFVLLAGLGNPEGGVEVPSSALRTTIERLAQ